MAVALLSHPSSSRRILIRILWLVVGAATALPARAELKPFSLPWDDSSATATDFSGLLHAPAGGDGWLEVDAAGHFVVAGRRERILGVNITAAAAFPPKAKADAIAARLAKFGINAVRFHHLEAPWQPTQVLIDYLVNSSGTPIGRSRQLSAERLDRLQYFISRLTAHGIYSNINLLVSRQFFADDGLPAEVEQLGWKAQHVLGFFNPTAFALQQEHAQKLLTAPDPYSGKTLARNPAVAFVEILNENGLLQNWYDQSLDNLPAVFANQLRDRWNAWLKTRYASTSALLTAWGAVDQPLGPDLLRNGTFASGAVDWNFEQHSTATATATGTTEFTGGGPALKIVVTKAGAENWHVQLNQAGLALTTGQIYTVSFSAKADSALPLSATLTRAGPTDFSTVQAIASPTLTTAWQSFSTTFVATADEGSVRINFSGFGARTGTVWLAALKVSKGGRAGTPPTGTSLEAGNIPSVARVGTGSVPAQKTDWVSFLLDLERTYWRGMRDTVKNTLNYGGLVFGTIVSTSPPGIQAELDVVDSHTYWQHPQFPTAEWDPVNWTVPNVSMVNSLDNPLGDLARQRVRGKPHMVTEYQHAQPNTYGAEGPLLAAAYGGLQDWDGLWLFAYGSEYDRWDRAYIDDFFNVDTHPTKLANLLVAANLFRRFDVAPARHEISLKFDDATQLDVATNRGGAWSVANAAHLSLSGRHALLNRINLQTGPSAGGSTAIPAAPTSSVLTADTGELKWDLSTASKGVVTIDTPRTKALSGFVANRTFDLGGWVFAPGATEQDWLTASVTTIDGSRLDARSGNRALVVLTGNVENTGQVWKDSTKSSVGTNWGHAPVLVEIVPLTLTLPFPSNRVSVWPLDVRGARQTALSVVDAGGGKSRVAFGGSSNTLWYELVIAPESGGVAPTLVRDLTGANVSIGAALHLSVAAGGVPAPSYVWRRDGVVLPETSAELTVAAATNADAGSYTVTVTNASGTATSRTARVAVGMGDQSALELINLSSRLQVLTGDSVMISGFVVGGVGQKEMLIRGVGPTLTDYGVAGALANPVVQIAAQNGTVIATNDDWDPAAVGDLITRLGAARLGAGSRDSALKLSLAPGVYSAIVSGINGTTGIALVELYDGGNATGSTARLKNISTRGVVGTGDGVLIAGFVIRGSAPKKLLIRAIGPSLVALGVANALLDPELRVVERSSDNRVLTLASNDNWWNDSNHLATQVAAAATGAYPLHPTSNDAAVVVTLEPGSYSAIVSGVRDDTGVALVEIYEVD